MLEETLMLMSNLKLKNQTTVGIPFVDYIKPLLYDCKR